MQDMSHSIVSSLLEMPAPAGRLAMLYGVSSAMQHKESCPDRQPINQSKEAVLLKSMTFLKNKAKTLEDIWNNSQYIINDKVEIGPEDKKLIDDLSKKIIKEFIAEYEKIYSLSRETLEPVIKSLIDKHKTNFKGVGQPLRIALVGSRFGPGLYDVILSLDKAEVIKRLSKI